MFFGEVKNWQYQCDGCGAFGVGFGSSPKLPEGWEGRGTDHQYGNLFSINPAVCVGQGSDSSGLHSKEQYCDKCIRNGVPDIKDIIE